MKNKILNVGMALGLMVYASSCTQDFLDVNQDPNNATNVDPQLVLPAAMTSTASAVGGEYALLGGIWSQYYTQNNGSNQYKAIDAFNLRPLDYNARWTEVYAGALNDYKYVINSAQASGNWNLNLIATAMQAYTYQVMADLYDQIPFDDALKGDEGTFNPTYQNGQQVYDGLIAKLDEALAKPVGGSTTLGNSDVIFQGNMTQWVRFANTLKLKIYLRQTEARKSVAEAGVRALYASGGNFLATSAAEAIWQDQTGKRNPLFEQDQSAAINTNQNLKASLTFLSFLTANNDPRLDKIYIPGSAGQRGLEQGNFNAPSTSIVPTTISRALILPTEPVFLISEAESYFLQAEAVVRGWGTGDAKVLYDKGIDASFRQLGLTSAQATTLINGAYAFPASGTEADKLTKIFTQKWAALAGSKQGLEAYFEHNRTDVPAISPVRSSAATYVPGQFTYPIEGVTSGKFAKRLLFVESERTRNTNTPPQQDITVKVWWDQGL